MAGAANAGVKLFLGRNGDTTIHQFPLVLYPSAHSTYNTASANPCAPAGRTNRYSERKNMTDFEGVVPALGQALNKRGYSVLTPVQEAMLAPELADADALVSAQTGSGKTIAFGMAVAPALLSTAAYLDVPLVLVVAPTRELALQVRGELEWLFEMTEARLASCVGGMDMRTERRALQRGAQIVVGTPGRLRDHIERGSLDTTGLKSVVLDEADEMLDLGFREDLEYILDAAPKERRTLMFSATVPRSITSLAKRYQRDAVRVVTTAEQTQHLDIDYRALSVAPNDRENAIVNVLRYFEAKNALVFCATRATVNHMTSRLNNRGFSVVALSGELSQNERTHALQAMRDGRARVCVATDVAARGIDLPNLELVVHADIPKSPETLLHRSGRTGRAGRKGICALVVAHNWRKRTERLLSSANIEATWERPPSADDVMAQDRERLLSDPSLSDPLNETEQNFAHELLARHSAEQIAAAFVRQHFGEKAAPEELLDAGPADRPKKPRDDFKGGVWFSLSVGREHKAEPRWLLPMLCRAGHITKHDVGGIRIQPSETFVELAPECVDKFLEALGPSRKIEKTITVTRLETPPDVGHVVRGRGKPRGKPHGKPKRKFASKADGQGGRTKPWEKTAKKPKRKKPKKPKSRAAAPRSDKQRPRAGAEALPGSAPLMRRKPKVD